MTHAEANAVLNRARDGGPTAATQIADALRAVGDLRRFGNGYRAAFWVRGEMDMQVTFACDVHLSDAELIAFAESRCRAWEWPMDDEHAGVIRLGRADREAA